MEHLEEPELAIRECYRVLKPNGIAIYTAPFIWHIHEAPRDFYRDSKYGLKYLFEKVGFEIIEIKALSGFWVTFGQLFVYNLYRLNKGPFRWFRIIDLLGLLIHGISYVLDKIDKTERSGLDVPGGCEEGANMKGPKGFEDDLQVVRDFTMLSRKRLLSLYECVISCEQNDLAGDYVECGVWKGGAVGLMALANLRYGKTKRHLHLFDTFEGIPEPDKNIDGERAVSEARKFGVEPLGRLTCNPQFYENMNRDVGTLQMNKKLLEEIISYDPHFIHYHKGFFQDTIPDIADHIGRVAILRLDGDWYSSTKVCLDHLYDKVVKRGFVIVDDYGAYEGCKKAVDEFLSGRNIKVRLRKVGSELRLLVKP